MNGLAKILFALVSLTVSAQAFAACWWQWEGVNSRYVCDECGSNGCSSIPVVENTTYSITVTNSCWNSGTSDVAIYYNDVNSGWRTDGYWKIAPGETKHLARSLSNEFYFWAKNQTHLWNGTLRREVNNTDRGFRYHNGTSLNLTCGN
jgi:hypothetical protein